MLIKRQNPKRKKRDGYKNMGRESKTYNMWGLSYDLLNGTLTLC